MRLFTRFLAHFLAFCALTLVAACGGDPAPSPAAKEGPALWQVQRGDMKGWLFGTIHVLPKGVAWETPTIRAAMAKADAVFALMTSARTAW